MPVHYGYTNTIYGTQSTINGSAHNYAFAPPAGSTWRYTGPDTYFVVDENTGATQFNGDPTNEVVSPRSGSADLASRPQMSAARRVR
ncbi:hypothetical protein ACFQFQ_12950 [Sulfitobacter porphyrae]|uniref:Uncharacterized protein n=1 Tax=Sulfitobacter porphyrae TaxID=1246864 RepID=A0ABW2B3B8_9RHOB